MDNEILEHGELDQPKFVVKTTLNAAHQIEAADAVQGKGFHIFSYVCMGLCTCMFIALIVIYFIDKNSSNLFMAALLVLTLAFLIYNKYSMPKKSMARWEQSIENSFGTKELHLTTEFYERSLIQILDESEDHMTDSGYSEITEMRETEHLFLLRQSKRQWYFVEKEGFQIGNADAFKKFITERIGGK